MERLKVGRYTATVHDGFTEGVKFGSFVVMENQLYHVWKRDGTRVRQSVARILTKAKPDETVSYLNGDTLDLRKENLVKLPRRRGLKAAGKTGYRGVTEMPSRKSPKRFRASFYHAGRLHVLGYYEDAENAAEAALEARRELGQ